MAESVERRQGPLSRRSLLSGAACAAVAGVAACGREEKTAEPPPTPDGPPKGSLEWAVAGPWRAQDKARDAARHPMETLRFFGLQPRMTVVEFWPGSGWYTEILAPYLAEGAGKYVAAGFQTGPGADPSQVALMAAFQQRFTTDKRLYGEIELSAFGPTSGPVTAPGTADMVLFMRNIHAWMAAGIAEKAFADAWAALRPGGVLGVEQHRLGPEEDQDPAAANGYVQEAFVKQLAAEAGFAFVAASEINANERDTKDHPFGVE
ncbi:MAG: class I SAM-dependent methyltransferase, partial [Brevundimonas sp.]